MKTRKHKRKFSKERKMEIQNFRDLVRKFCAEGVLQGGRKKWSIFSETLKPFYHNNKTPETGRYYSARGSHEKKAESR